MSLHLVLGGVRSGKSRYAQELASSHEKVIYVATANAKDDSMKERVKRHQADRPKSWTTLEAYRDFSAHKKELQEADFVIVDCLTFMLSRLLFEKEEKVEHFQWSAEELQEVEEIIHEQIDELIDALGSTPSAIVSNEVGLGVVPESWLGNVFRDISGRAHQRVGARASEVTLMVAGIPLKIKE
ncbi:MAG: bifunctional adenosylcobinamide kinase/adenosylcobinamide-phosphate guanylyltransferase [Tissierellia bacterium]|mgnify:CR=1 FL=1|nr:bifunctional adenosylcobinamide kinase/adenosylcobinamide-phosphate guanylyltransferase [Bacillota bacterium]NLL22175.1 bifunctional adenosylcobinamide kinase/adenosylcobinamide-phosphate guanylyltransferase [Tissierellia bacterium]